MDLARYFKKFVKIVKLLSKKKQKIIMTDNLHNKKKHFVAFY